MNEIDLKIFGIQRPEKIVWKFPYVSGDPIEIIKSKTTRAFLRTSQSKLQEFHITHQIKEVTETDFIHWHEYYQKKMQEQGYEVIATLDWYHQRIDEKRKIFELVLTQNDLVVGTEIFTITAENRGIAAFKASERMEDFSKKRQSIGAVIDYLVIRFLINYGVSEISFGKSRNAFGVINTLGNLDYKLRFGFIPTPDQKSPLLESVALSPDGTVLFYGLKNGQLSMFAFQPKGTVATYEPARFATSEIPFEIIEY